MWDCITQPLKGHDAGDHSPITPLVATSSATFHDADASRLYDFVVRYFISTVGLVLHTVFVFKLQNNLCWM